MDWLSPLTLAEIIAICKEYQIYVSDAARRKREKMVSLIQTFHEDARVIFEQRRDCKKNAALPNKRKSDLPVQGPRKKMKNSGPSAGINGDDTMDKSDEITLPSIVNNNHITTSPEFLHIPSQNELRDCQAEFLQAISPSAVREAVCAVCALLCWEHECSVVNVRNIPNAGRLQPADQDRHPAQVLIAGMLLEEKGVIEVKGKCSATLCGACLQDLHRDKIPRYSLSNKMWIGNIPHQLSCLTIPEQLLLSPIYPHCFIFKMYPKGGAQDDPTCLQSGLHGNVTSYPMNTDEIFSMLQGHMLPRPMEILPSIISGTYVGVSNLPKHWLKSTFRIWRRVVLEALEWLIEHNKCFSEYTVDQAVMASLPKDDVPLEILASMRQETSSHILLREHDSMCLVIVSLQHESYMLESHLLVWYSQ
ncbi:uncharacterized protein EI90DRAFT_3130716 [Cantharellus anzutake]|uniref:uncharacterized protein n=1 Tax=Cantharellus anzutake TaxID=1750568 RepID=UPI001905B768|nr:uncharacterized protein EI90DRAFT_3130716 [Cantharellus anzutake]KAF8322918.1 hypothetical protein EI90DRAFT_3130716 [Cantharellus anzutake]